MTGLLRFTKKVSSSVGDYAQAIVEDFLGTFRAFPPRQKAASFTIDQALERMQDAASGARD